MNPSTGELKLDGEGRPVLRHRGLLVDGPEIELLEFQPFDVGA